jgi:hypothetical protein
MMGTDRYVVLEDWPVHEEGMGMSARWGNRPVSNLSDVLNFYRKKGYRLAHMPDMGKVLGVWLVFELVDTDPHP